MPRCFDLILVGICLIFPWISAHAIALPVPQVLEPRIEHHWLTGHLAFLKDSSGQMTLEQVRQAEAKGQFQSVPSRDIPSGYLAGKPIWVRFAVEYPIGDATVWWLQMAPELLDTITLYAEQPNGGFTVHHGGRSLPFRQRELESITHNFKLGPDPGGVRRYYLRITLNSAIKIEPSLWKEKALIGFLNRVNSILGVYVGIVTLMILMAIVRAFRYGNDWDYAYLGYLLGFELFHLNNTGLLQVWGMTDSLVIRNALIQMGILLTGQCFVALTRSLIAWPRSSPLPQRIYRGGQVLLLLSLGLVGIIYPAHFPELNFSIAVSLLALSLIAGLWASWHDYPNARALTLSFLPFVVWAVFVSISRYVSEWGVETWTRNLVLMGTTLLHMFSLWLMVLNRDARISEAKRQLEARVSGLQREMSNTTLFLEMLAHELNRPLQALTNLTKSHPKTGNAGDELSLRHRLAAICADFSGILETCTDRIRQASTHTLKPAPVDVRKLVQGVINHFQQKSERHLIRFDLENLPDEFCCDPKLTGILISNLLENAIRHSPDGSLIWVSGQCTGNDTIQLSITDEGPGIPLAMQSRIFDRYVQLQTGHEKPRIGMGLGLFIVRRIAEMHGGDVICESKPGEGSTFCVTLKSCRSDPLSTRG